MRRPHWGAVVLIVLVWAVIVVSLLGSHDPAVPAPLTTTTTGVALPSWLPPSVPETTTVPPRPTTIQVSRSYRRTTTTTADTSTSAPPAPVKPQLGRNWMALKMCESHNNYSENTGNGYYGAYQFSASTWHSLGYSGLPHQASPTTQDEAAQRLLARSGWHQWPVCGRLL